MLLVVVDCLGADIIAPSYQLVAGSACSIDRAGVGRLVDLVLQGQLPDSGATSPPASVVPAGLSSSPQCSYQTSREDLVRRDVDRRTPTASACNRQHCSYGVAQSLPVWQSLGVLLSISDGP